MNNFKITALGALATIGLASAAIAQPKVDHQPDRAQGAQQQERGDCQGAEDFGDGGSHLQARSLAPQ